MYWRYENISWLYENIRRNDTLMRVHVASVKNKKEMWKNH